jgi:predicted metalloprotease with PDZ domain
MARIALLVSFRCATLLAASFLCLGSYAGARTETPKPTRITADLTESGRSLYHAEIDLPVRAGPLTLTTPLWIPGRHGPAGSGRDIVGVVFTAQGQVLPWRRDDINLYQFHLDVPAGVTTLHAHLDCVGDNRADDAMSVLEWDKLLLYPADRSVRELIVQPTVIVPKGWGVGTALAPAVAYDPNTKPGGAITFQALSVERLLDSPVVAGEHFREFALAPEITPRHYIDVVSETAEQSNLNEDFLGKLANLVREASLLFRSRHYESYHFLLTQSNALSREGFEHAESSNNGVGESSFQPDSTDVLAAYWLSHGLVHSWNGKYRRPIGMVPKDFTAAESTELLWVYEGLTDYLGYVLATRAGFYLPEEYRTLLASHAAEEDHREGRRWRSTQDVSIAASLFTGRTPDRWADWRRERHDAYYDGALLWLEADTLIRSRTQGKKSLDDFARLFLGRGGNTGPLVVSYDRTELIRDLNAVLPYDWATLLHERIDLVQPHANLAGIERGGYKLAYLDTPDATRQALDAKITRADSGLNEWYTLGLTLAPDGTIRDVRFRGVADEAKVSPGEKLVSVDGQAYSPQVLRAAIKASPNTTSPLHFEVQSRNRTQSYELAYHGGTRIPALVRIDGTPSLIDTIVKPLAAPAAHE